MLDFLIDGLRTLIWALMKVCLFVIDWVYNLINDISTLDLGLDNTTVRNFFIVMTTVMLLIVILRMFFMYFKSLTDDDDETFSSGDIIQRVFLVFLATVSVPALLLIANKSTVVVQNVAKSVLGYEITTQPSTMILSNTYNITLSSDYNDLGDTGNVIKIDDIKDINEKKDGDKTQYRYFVGMPELLFALVLSICAIIVFFGLLISFGFRTFTLAYKGFLSPLATSSLIKKGDDTFANWFKSYCSDLLTNQLTILAIFFSFEIISSSAVSKLGGIAKVILMLISLLAVNGIGSVIAELMGTRDTSGQGVRRLADIRQATRGIGAMVGLGGTAMGIGKQVLDEGLGIGAGVLQKGGQALGGKPLSDFDNRYDRDSGMSSFDNLKSPTKNNDFGGFGERDDLNNNKDFSGVGNVGNSFSDSNKQFGNSFSDSNKQFGNNGNNSINDDTKNRNENGTDSSGFSTNGFTGGNNMNVNDDIGAEFGSVNNQDNKPFNNEQSWGTPNTDTLRAKPEKERMSRENSFARNFDNWANSLDTTGNAMQRGFAKSMRVTSHGASHTYKNLGQAYEKTHFKHGINKANDLAEKFKEI